MKRPAPRRIVFLVLACAAAGASLFWVRPQHRAIPQYSSVTSQKIPLDEPIKAPHTENVLQKPEPRIK